MDHLDYLWLEDLTLLPQHVCTFRVYLTFVYLRHPETETMRWRGDERASYHFDPADYHPSAPDVVNNDLNMHACMHSHVYVAGDTSANERVHCHHPRGWKWAGWKWGTQYPKWSTSTLKDQVSEFSALQMWYNKVQMPALPNCKEVSPLSICPSTAECPWPALQEAACLSHERAEGEEGGLLWDWPQVHTEVWSNLLAIPSTAAHSEWSSCM